MATIYLVGTWHHLARASIGFVPKAETEAFQNEIRRLVSEYSIAAFVEEDVHRPDDICDRETVAEKLGKSLCIPSERIDLDESARQSAGYGKSSGKTRSEIDDFRETHWMSRIATVAQTHASILFILGGCHVTSMGSRLRAAAFEVIEVHACWGGRWLGTEDCDPAVQPAA
jgi:hypothetical protein